MADEEFRFQLLIKQSGKLGTRSEKEESCRGHLMFGRYMDLKAFEDPLKVLLTFNLAASEVTLRQRDQETCVVEIEAPMHLNVQKIRLSMHPSTYDRLKLAKRNTYQMEMQPPRTPSYSAMSHHHHYSMPPMSIAEHSEPYTRMFTNSSSGSTIANTFNTYDSSTLPANYRRSCAPMEFGSAHSETLPAQFRDRRSAPLHSEAEVRQQLKDVLPPDMRQSMSALNAMLAQSNLHLLVRVGSDASGVYDVINDSEDEQVAVV